MQCPVCNSSPLKPTMLSNRLPARECIKCHAMLVDLLSYRVWAEYTPNTDVITPYAEAVEDNSEALVCPKCSKLMLKYKISEGISNRVDVCTNCDMAWLDGGEWELLGSLSLQKKLTAIFTEPWQRHIRKEEITVAQEQRISALLGDEDYKKIMEVKEWIDNHPRKEDLLRVVLKTTHRGSG